MYRNQCSSIWRTVAALALVVVAVIAVSLLNADQLQAEAPEVQMVTSGGSLDTGFFTCVLHDDGELECWKAGQGRIEHFPIGPFHQVSVGPLHACGIRQDGDTLDCWTLYPSSGDDNFTLNAPKGQFSEVSIAGRSNDVGGSYEGACALRNDGHLACWGWNEYSVTVPEALQSTKFVQVSVSLFRACGLQANHLVACWSWRGGLLDTPEVPFRLVRFGHANCGVLVSGAMHCFSLDGSPSSERFASEVTTAFAGLEVIDISEDGHCVLTVVGSSVCWRYGEDGDVVVEQQQAEADPCQFRSHPGECVYTFRPNTSDPPTGAFTMIDTEGSASGCGIRTDGEIECWGTPSWWTSSPTGVFAQISGDCGLRPSGVIVCWGNESHTNDHLSPAERYVRLSRYCALRENGRFECSNNGIISHESDQFAEISSDGSLICGLREDGTVECTGWVVRYDYPESVARYAEFFGTTTFVRPEGSFDAIDVSADGYWCGLRTDGAIECQSLFEVDHEYREGPYVQISVGGMAEACGLLVDGTIVCWGVDSWGRADVPKGRFQQVSLNSRSACAIDLSGKVHCWGGDPYYGTSFARGHAAQPQPDSLTARVVARRLDDGRIEFALQAPDEPRILPDSRLFPRNAPLDRWLSASTISYHGEPLGRIAARRLADGRTEFSFVTPDGERLLPDSRRLPANPSEGWKRSSEIDIPLPSCRLSDPVENGFTFPTRNVTIDDSDAVYRVTGVPLKWSYSPEQIVGDNVRLPAEWIRTGSDVRYLVCGDEPTTDQAYDRALFTAGYFYSYNPGGNSSDELLTTAIEVGLQSAETGFDAYIDHYDQVALSTFVRQGLQFMQLVLIADALNTALATADIASQAGIAAADSWFYGELSNMAVELGLDVTLELSQETLDAIRANPEEIVKQMAWSYVEDAWSTGRVWRPSIANARASDETLTYAQARLLLDWETVIAHGRAGLVLDWVLKLSEVRLWERALTAIPFGVGTTLGAIFALQDSAEALDRQVLNDFNEWLKGYPPYSQLTQGLDQATQLLAIRHEQLNERLGIDPDSLAP